MASNDIVTIECIGFRLIETTTKVSKGKVFKAENMEVHYIAYPNTSHEVRGTITLPYSEHIYLPEISRRIQAELTATI